jgi:hypothetical protein
MVVAVVGCPGVAKAHSCGASISFFSSLNLSSSSFEKRTLPTLVYSTASFVLRSMPSWTRDSQTPSQFHSPGCLGEACAFSTSFPAGLLPRVCWLVSPRCARQACQALGFPAASRGILSKNSSSAKDAFRCCSTFKVVLLESCNIFRPLAVAVRSLPSSRPCEASNLPSLSLLLSRLVRRLPCRPYHSGKPCRRLKLPGGRRSSSEALTVPTASRAPVLKV